MTAADAVAACLARGVLREPECAAQVADRMVGGVYCDGTIVQDVNGSRCVPRSTLDAKEAARAASPLPVRTVAPSSTAPLWPWLVGGVLCAGVVLALVLRKG